MSVAQIREATCEEIPRMVEMGRRFATQTSYSQFIEENPAQMARLGERLITTPNSAILVLEREGAIIGMLGYLVYEHFISGERIAGEVFWWVEPEARGEGLQLMTEAEKRAKAAGAKHFQFIAPTKQLERIYRRLDYKWVESTYQKSL